MFWLSVSVFIALIPYEKKVNIPSTPAHCVPALHSA